MLFWGQPLVKEVTLQLLLEGPKSAVRHYHRSSA